MIHVNNLNKYYEVKLTSRLFWNEFSKIHALKNISFDLEDGENLGILGLNGSGKTTLIKILVGILIPDTGSLDMNGFEPRKRSREYLKNIGLFMGTGRTQLTWDLPAIDSLRLSRFIYEYSEFEFNERINKLKKAFFVEEEINQNIRNMSLGQRMKMELIYSILHFPKILFLDEPTLGLDIVTQDSFRKYIKWCNKELGMNILITSHNLKDIELTCKRSILMHNGELIFDGAIEKIKNIDKFRCKIQVVLNDANQAKFLSDKYIMKCNDSTVSALKSKQEAKSIVEFAMSNLKVQDIKIENESLEDILIRLYKESNISVNFNNK